MRHKVSHSNIKTAPVPAEPVQRHRHFRYRNVRLRLSTNAIKSVDHRGGFDAFLLKAKATDLSRRALELKRQIEKKTSAGASEKKAG